MHSYRRGHSQNWEEVLVVGDNSVIERGSNPTREQFEVLEPQAIPKRFQTVHRNFCIAPAIAHFLIVPTALD
jgi:hypothetical protein